MLPNLSALGLSTDAGLKKRLLPEAASVKEGSDEQKFLVKFGYVVIGTPFANPPALAAARAGFDAMLRESPEFLNVPADFDAADGDSRSWQPVRGGFAALGNPSSFHHPYVRRKREELMAVALDADVLPLRGRALEKPFDRVTFRRAGQTPTKESVHRDSAPNAVDGDDVFGGWLNLDGGDQFFHCCPWTHKEVGKQNKGFAPITDKTEQAQCQEKMERVRIPSGHLLIFFERLVHEVAPSPAPKDLRRIHCGWRLTNATEPLFGAAVTNGWIDKQAVPQIKSGQEPLLWPRSYANFSARWADLQTWSQRTFKPSLLFTATVGGAGEFVGQQWVRVKAKCPSLESMGMKFRDYDLNERAVLFPRRIMSLYSVGGGDERTRYVLPGADDFVIFKQSRRDAPLGGEARRPMPSMTGFDGRGGPVTTFPSHNQYRTRP